MDSDNDNSNDPFLSTSTLLNLVAIPRSTPNTANPLLPTKKKKLNKYEKRRRLSQQRQQQHQQLSPPLPPKRKLSRQQPQNVKKAKSETKISEAQAQGGVAQNGVSMITTTTTTIETEEGACCHAIDIIQDEEGEEEDCVPGPSSATASTQAQSTAATALPAPVAAAASPADSSRDVTNKVKKKKKKDKEMDISTSATGYRCVAISSSSSSTTDDICEENDNDSHKNKNHNNSNRNNEVTVVEEEEEEEEPTLRNSHHIQNQNHSSASSSSFADRMRDATYRAQYMAEFHARPLELDRRNRHHHHHHATAALTTTAHARRGRSSNSSNNNDRHHSGNHVFATGTRWQDLPLHPQLISAATSLFGYEQPTVVQAQAISAFFQSKPSQPSNNNNNNNNNHNRPHNNVLLQAETGSGKTLAYFLPILQSVLVKKVNTNMEKVGNNDEGSDGKDENDGNRHFNRSSGTRCIILCPTRELASQIYNSVVDPVIRHASSCCHWIVPGCLLGGMSRSKCEKARLRKGLSIIVATPGRFLDHLLRTESLGKSLQKRALEWLVLDEADRLLEMGLGEQVMHIVQRIVQLQNMTATTPTITGKGGTETSIFSWRSVLVSATVTPRVEKLARELFPMGKGECSDRNHSHSHSWIYIHGGIKEEKEKSSEDDTGENQHRTTNEHELPSEDVLITKEAITTTSASSSSSSSSSSTLSAIASTEFEEFAQSTPPQLMQLYMTVSAKLRLPTLIAFLAARSLKHERTVVFLSTCAAVDYYYALLSTSTSILDPTVKETNNDIGNGSGSGSRNSGLLGKHCSIYKLHGKISHTERQQTLQQFVQVGASSPSPASRSESSKAEAIAAIPTAAAAAVLLATDVASRGLNLPNIDWIVQYDPPGEIAEYVHRAGRAARAGKAGQSLLFLLPSEMEFLDLLQKRGVQNMSALSLTVTLNAAAKLCAHVTAEGVRRSGGDRVLTKHKSYLSSSVSSSRLGEAFASEIQRRLEQYVIDDNENAKTRAVANGKAGRKSKRWSSASLSSSSTAPGRARADEPQSLNPNALTLLDLARNAFVSHLRSYPAKEKPMRHVFCAKALHLGHVARSFALREPPSKLASMTTAAKLHTRSRSSAVIENAESKKRRNVAMEFGRLEGHTREDLDLKASRDLPPPTKKQKYTPQQRKQMLLLSNAMKMQVSGLEGM